MKTEKIANNTKRYLKDDNIVIRYHDTDIVTIAPDGTVTLNSGGWRTMSTKDRINRFSPVEVRPKGGIWYVITESGEVPFFDGIKIKDGKVLNKSTVNVKDITALIRQINKYCKLVTKDCLPLPASGDCFDCCMEECKNHTHLLSHIDVGCIPGRLLINAMKDAGYTDESIKLHYEMKLVDTFRRALRRYLKKRLITQ